jgi:RNA 2',3'-cyclic 3'-phosphodiesterase
MAASDRLFIALKLPASCRETLAALDPQMAGVRWLPAEQLHLTMSFLGNVPRDHRTALEDALQGVQVPRFFLPIQGLGSFGPKGRPSVIWAGVGKGHPHLFALHRRIQDAVLHAGLAADLRPFHPHVTVARCRDVRAESLRPFLRKYEQTEFGLFEATCFALFSSLLAPEGAQHFEELEVTL